MSFTYNDEGIRTSKTVNGVNHTYQLNGSQIASESWGDKLIVYLYDASGSPIGMMYRTTSYAINQWDVFYFEKNLQGDVVAVYNSAGTKVVTYTYTDAWGNHSVKYANGGASTGAAYNPFRYRGYYYDIDLVMYYLQSRYYDAKICRFINADSALYHSMLGYNMFAYCNNNPINYFDPTGEYCVAHVDDRNPLDDWILEGAGAGGLGATGNYFGYGTTYYTYTVYSATSSYNAYLGGYHTSSLTSGMINSNYYYVRGAVSVNDSMAVHRMNTRASNNSSYNLNGSKNETYVAKRGWDSDKINYAINNGKRGISINKANGSQCIVYRYPGTTNQYVVVEAETRSIVQLSDLNDAGWIPDSSIIWDP